MNKPLQTSSRLGVVDALRGFALLAIVLLHNWNITTFTLSPILSPNGYKL